MENNEAEKGNKEKRSKSRPRELSNLLKNNIFIIRVPEDGESEKMAEGLCEQSIAENFPSLGKDTDNKIQEVQRAPIKFNNR